MASSKLEEALRMWRGAPFAEFAGEAFVRDEAVRLEELRLASLEQRIWADLELGRHEDIVEELQELTAQHPFRECFWEQLMLTLYRGGRQAEALRTYQKVRLFLADELGIDPGPALARMEQRVLAQDPELERRPGSTARASPGALPPQRTSFVGRRRELEKVARLLSASRLLTLTGPPGSGKTRLALELAAEQMSRFAHGAFFVALAAVSDPRLMSNTIAGVLDLHDRPGETALEGITSFLRDRQALLVLDNFEQILPAAPQVGELLDAAPSLTIMVTSRASLGIAGEQEYAVPPLQLPVDDGFADPEAIADYDAVALFVTRVCAVDPDFKLDAGNASDVAQLTARLDGLPLAIELAAARIKMLTPGAMLGRLEQRLTLLTAAPADSTDRHRTMRDAIGWSYDLLEPSERALFRRLGVFRGGFTLEAATAVADPSGSDIFGSVEALLTRSLLYRPAATGPARYAMLETIREFAQDQLAAAGEQQEVGSRHANYFRRLAEDTEPHLTLEPAGGGSQQLSAEVDNIRGALRYALDAGQPDLGLRLASCIWRHWQSSEQLAEGRDWLEELLAHPRASAAARAAGLTALAGLAYWQADYDESWVRYEEALDVFRFLGDRLNEADTLFSMSVTANWRGEVEVGERLAETARSQFEELGSREGVGRALMAQGFSRFRRKEFASAQELYEESLVIARTSGDQPLAATLLLGIAAFVFHQGDLKRALSMLLEAVGEATELHNAHLTVWMLDFVAAFAASTAPEEAVRLAGAVHSLREAAGGGMRPEALDVENARSAAARVLAPAQLNQAWAQGRELSLAEAVSQAHLLNDLVTGMACRGDA
jgi:predicted ATPase